MYKCGGLKILRAFKVDKNQRKVVTIVVLIVLKTEAATLLQTIFKSKAKVFYIYVRFTSGPMLL